MNVVDHLKAARALIADPKRWTQGINARDALGYQVMPEEDDATCFCMNGALRRAGPEDSRRLALQVLGHITGEAVWNWNDDVRRTHAEVLGAFDRAIALAEMWLP